MLCRISDLITDVPDAGGMASRCKEYLYTGSDSADIIIRTEFYNPEKYDPSVSYERIAYVESGRQFYPSLYKFNGMVLHSSAIEVNNKAFLFSGKSGVGKSTHTRIWHKRFDEKAQIFNDDKPALRRIDGKWYAYGTPWCGKDGINQNKKVPIAGICFLKQSPVNKIRRLSKKEAVIHILSQTYLRKLDTEQFSQLSNIVNDLVNSIPVFELENRPEPEAALLSYETMRCAAEELGL